MISKKLQLKGERDFGESIVGSLVVGNHLYVLGSVLYRCEIDGDTIGEPEPLVTVENPNSIYSDGTFLYLGVTFDGSTSGSRLAIVRISDFSLRLHSANLIGSTNRINEMFVDRFGLLHILFENRYWRVYDYDRDLNTLTQLLNVDIGTTLSGMVYYKDDVIINRGNGFLTYRYSWDGSAGLLVYFADAVPFTRTVKTALFGGYLLGVHSAGTGAGWQAFVYTTGESDFEKLNTNELNLEGENQIALKADGLYGYTLSSTNLRVLQYEDSILSVAQKITLPESVANNYEFPNRISIGHNKVFLAVGDKILLLRWAAHAQFSFNVDNRTVTAEAI